jgi:GTP-binding protein HflX
MIRQKIQHHRAKLRDFARHRSVVRSGRQSMLTLALVGYTNAGKSSVLRSLSHESDVVVEDRLFATLDTLTREVDLGESVRVRMTDTVGFIRKLPHHLVASFRATLEEAGDADLLLHVIDASHPQWEDQLDVVEGVLGDLELDDMPALMIFNKSDRLTDRTAFGALVREVYPGAVVVNTVEPGGLDELRAALRERARGLRPVVRVVIPVTDGKRIAEVYRPGEVVSREDTPEGVVLSVRMDEWKAKRLGASN